MKSHLGAMFVLILSFTSLSLSTSIAENPIAFHLNYAEGEKNTYAYTQNGCRIIGKLYSPDKAKLKKKEKSPMADMPVLQEHRVKKGSHTTVFKKVKPPKKKLKKQEPAPVAQDANFDLTQAEPTGADAKKPAKSFALQAKVYGNKHSVLSWSHEGERYSCHVNFSALPLSSFTAFESANNTYLFFYHPEDLRKSESSQRHKPAAPTWENKKGVQAVLIEGDSSNEEAQDAVEALLDIYATHKKDLKQVYKDYKKRQKELAKQPKVKSQKPITSEVFYYRSK